MSDAVSLSLSDSPSVPKVSPSVTALSVSPSVLPLGREPPSSGHPQRPRMNATKGSARKFKVPIVMT
jgi:hypothetical protein